MNFTGRDGQAFVCAKAGNAVTAAIAEFWGKAAYDRDVLKQQVDTARARENVPDASQRERSGGVDACWR